MTNVHYLRTQLTMAADCIRRGLDALEAEPGKCLRAPAGWECQREEGHEGPCAAGVTRSGEMVDASGNTIKAELAPQYPGPGDDAPPFIPYATVGQVEALGARLAALEMIALDLNVEVCIKHGLNPF